MRMIDPSKLLTGFGAWWAEMSRSGGLDVSQAVTEVVTNTLTQAIEEIDERAACVQRIMDEWDNLLLLSNADSNDDIHVQRQFIGAMEDAVVAYKRRQHGDDD